MTFIILAKGKERLKSEFASLLKEEGLFNEVALIYDKKRYTNYGQMAWFETKEIQRCIKSYSKTTGGILETN